MVGDAGTSRDIYRAMQVHRETFTLSTGLAPFDIKCNFLSVCLLP